MAALTRCQFCCAHHSHTWLCHVVPAFILYLYAMCRTFSAACLHCLQLCSCVVWLNIGPVDLALNLYSSAAMTYVPMLSFCLTFFSHRWDFWLCATISIHSHLPVQEIGLQTFSLSAAAVRYSLSSLFSEAFLLMYLWMLHVSFRTTALMLTKTFSLSRTPILDAEFWMLKFGHNLLILLQKTKTKNKAQQQQRVSCHNLRFKGSFSFNTQVDLHKFVERVCRVGRKTTDINFSLIDYCF